MKNTTNIIRTAAVILTLMITTANFAHAGNPVAKQQTRLPNKSIRTLILIKNW